jgi:RNA recognition motif-containing protein
MKTIYVGNLPFSSTQAEITDLFSRFGTVHSVNLISDRETGRPRGFGFVEMDPEQALAAIEALNGTELGGRSLRVNEARGREDRGGGGDRRGGGGNFRRNDY